MDGLQWLSVALAVVSLVGGIVTIVVTAGTVFIAWGRISQKLNDHTQADERRFAQVELVLTEIRTDIKSLIAKRAR